MKLGTIQQHNTYSLAGAMARYERLCGPPHGLAENVYGALPMVRAGLAHTCLLQEILRAVAQAQEPQVASTLARQCHMTLQNASTRLLTLSRYEFLTRQAVPIKSGGSAYAYRLSPFGTMVLEVPTDKSRTF